MMQMAHHSYNLLFRWMHEMLMIHHFAFLLFKNYPTIQVGTLQRIHHQYNRYELALDDTLIGIENLSSGYLTHHIWIQRLDLGTWKPFRMIWKAWHQIMNQCKQLFTGFCRVGTFYQFPCFAYDFLVFSFRGVRFCFGEYL